MDSLLTKVPLAPHTTLKVGGVAECFASVTSEAELDTLVGFSEENNLPLTILGGGSNVLVSDEGVAGLVLQVAIDSPPEVTPGNESDAVLVTATAGMEFDALVAWTVEEGYWGLENLSHIPGSVGATPIQNVGAYGVEVKDCIFSVRVYNTKERKFETLTNAECEFGYRDSVFKHGEGKHYIVTAVTYELSREPKPLLSYRDLASRFAEAVPTLKQVREAVIDIRAAKFPNWREVGTAGSFFKNPVVTKNIADSLLERYPELPTFPAPGGHVKLPLGWLLDKVLGLKGAGGEKVGQYEGQALVLINKGEATAADIVDHAETVAQRVHEEIGVTIEWEVTKVGF